MSKDFEAPANGYHSDELEPQMIDESDSEDGSDVDFVLDKTPEIDETEHELERLVFGDIAGFKSGLSNFDAFEETTNDRQLVQTDGDAVDDTDLFFTDLGPDQGVGATEQKATESNDYDQHAQKAVWQDSDDERMEVSLATVPRLRKLRKTEAEDVISGKEYIRRLRQQFELLHPRPDWAATGNGRKRRRLSTRDAGSDDDDMDTDSDGNDAENDDISAPPLSALLRDASSLVRANKPQSGKRRKIRPETITISRRKDVGDKQPSAITSMSFHPAYPLLLSSGPSSTIYLHQIASSPPAEKSNPLLISLHIRGAPLATSAFHPTDSRIFMAAKRKFFHMWNLETGRVEKVSQGIGQKHEQKNMDRFKLSPDGQYMALVGKTRSGGIINIISASTLQWQAQVRVETLGGIADFAWWRNGKGLCILGKNGEVTEWSMNEQKVVMQWQDEGAVGSAVLTLGGHHEWTNSTIGDDRWVATGSSSGIVNVYDRRLWLDEQDLPSAPTPTKTLDHLTTPITNLAFSSDGQIMAMASKWKRDAFRLVHLPSVTVFKNWPTSATPLGTITAVSFADGAMVDGNIHSLLAVANEQGKIRLWEIS